MALIKMESLVEPPLKHVVCKKARDKLVKGHIYLYRVSSLPPRFCILSADEHRHIVALTLQEMRKHMELVPNVPPVPVTVSFKEALRLYPA